MTATLLNRIREDSLAARKAREGDKASFLITLLAEASRPGKDDGNRESTDAEVLKVIKKFIDNTEITLKALGAAASDARTRAELELAMLRAYQPKQATEAEVRAAVDTIVASLPERNLKQIGAVMGKLQAQFDGNFDKGLASTLVKAALA